MAKTLEKILTEFLKMKCRAVGNICGYDKKEVLIKQTTPWKNDDASVKRKQQSPL